MASNLDPFSLELAYIAFFYQGSQAMIVLLRSQFKSLYKRESEEACSYRNTIRACFCRAESPGKPMTLSAMARALPKYLISC